MIHKNIAFDTTELSFVDIQAQFKTQFSTLPAIKDGETVHSDSFNIADYLEAHYPESPSLFGGEKGRLMALFSMSGQHHYIRTSPKLLSLTFTASLKNAIKITFVPLEINTFRTA
ncbi:glutathione S-transferase N-terminal domain-containing protein [Vibrio kanaloae]|uniref:glutathione S-transferase N-terminal domain-containing protein n=1 Tax=Vibrio kanaloae TaxID=170673 RepID=UPI001EFC38C5|nr:glutathione S-transferase N-terminal domain-containing protein [Vibrio kanaloae]MCG9559263.1 glutathione S-transferase N-terminal domain-containing protein [Vibrio kanaloae]